ncbi:hypothetical protein [Desulfoluna butyratoxydans]|nr:hypothetical protein [Desulfoluna butyratoxydans]
MAFPEFWVLTLHRLAQWGLPENLFKSPGAEFGEGRGLSPWLLRGALVRILLARFLFSRGTARSVTFLAWLERLFLPGLMGEYGIMGRDRVALLLREMSFGRKGAFGFVESFWSELYRQLGWGGTPSRLPTDPERLFLWDPIARFMMYSPGRDPSPEILFVQRGVQYLKDSAKPDPLFSRLFFQVLRLRCIYYRHVVQRPMTPGLLWFVRHYGRNKPGRDWASGALAVRFAAQSCGFGKGLRSLEVRTVPKDSVRAMLSLLKGCVTAVNGMAAASGREGPPEFGLVIHFAKARGKEAVKGIPHGNWKGTHADPAPMNETRRSRYSGYYRQQRQRGMTLARTLVRFPFSLQLIRGMDICTDELGVPSWVFVPIFRYIRDAGNETSIYLRSAYGKEVPPLRTTIHTGEDFVHLLGGLRRVEETLRYFDLGPGDRIGHGMALGTDPEAWVAKKDRVVMTREDRLFDLVWEWGRYSTGQLPCPGSRSSFLEREIARLSTKIFPESKTPYEMALLLDDLHDEQMMKNVGYPECEKIRVPDKKDKSKIERLVFLFHYLTCKLCFDRGHETEWVHLGPEVEPMQQLQKYIREKVASEGIVVEVNPTSNLLIGNLTDLAHHPFWRLKSPVDKSDGPSVALCIGSDDPLTFATDLRQEYVLLYESLVEGGLASSDAWEWVEQVRETGMNSRFTLPVEHVQNQNGGGPSYFVYPQKYVRFGTDQLLSPMP